MPPAESLILPDLQMGVSPVGIVAALLIIAGGWGLGCLLLRLLRLNFRQPVDGHLLASVIGLNLLSFLFLLTGMIRIPPAFAWIVLLLAATLAGCWVTAWRRPRYRRQHWPLLLFFPVALIPLGRAFCYPVGWDELVYHLSNARRWLADGSLIVYPDSAYSALPSGADFLFTLGIHIGNPVTPGALNYCFWVLGIIMLFRMLRLWTVGRRIIAVVVTLSFALSNASITLSMETYVEFFLLLQVLAFLILLRQWREPEGWQPRALAGSFAGFAIATKLTALAPLPALALLALRRWGKRRAWVALLVFFVLALAYYQRSWLATGNPTYPFFAQVFSPDDEVAQMVSEYHRSETSDFGAKTPREFLLLPFHLATDRTRYDGVLGLQWLAIIPLALLAVFRYSRSRIWALAGIIVFLIWIQGSQQIRFILPAALFGYLLATQGAALLSRGAREVVLVIILGLSVYDSHVWNLRRVGDQWQVLLGRQTMAEYVEPWVGYGHIRAVRAVATHTDAEATILMIMDKRTFYFNRRMRDGTPFFQGHFLMPPESFAEPGPLLTHLREHGIDYLLFGIPRRDPDRSERHERRADGLVKAIAAARSRGELEEVWSDAPYMLLRVP